MPRRLATHRLLSPAAGLLSSSSVLRAHSRYGQQQQQLLLFPAARSFASSSSSIKLPLSDVRSSPSLPPQTILGAFLRSVERYPSNDFLGSRRDATTPYTYLSYSKSWSYVRSLAHSFQSLDLHNPVILSPNCPANILATYACYCRSVPTIPLYPTLSASSTAIKHILDEVKAGTYLVDYRMVDKIVEAKKVLETPGKGTLIVMGNSINDTDWKSLSSTLASIRYSNIFEKVLTLDDLVRDGDAARAALYATSTETEKCLVSLTTHPLDSCYITPPQPSTAATLSYTSGTTSNPKGVVLTHRNITAVTQAVFNKSFIAVDEHTKHFSYLPLPHIFERAVTSGLAGFGGSLSFMRFDVDPKVAASYLVDDMSAVRPTVFFCAPRVVNKLKGRVEMAVSDDSPKSRLVRHAFEQKMKAFKENNDVKNIAYDVLMNAISGKIGLRDVRTVVCGSAPISADALAFFSVLLPSCKVLEGYGLTETSGGVALNSADAYPDYNQFGTVGELMGNCEVKLVDHEGGGAGGGGGLEKKKKKKTERGEIWVRGDNVSEGYYGGENSDNGEMIIKKIKDKDGWFRTGDVGVWDDKTGGLKIVDRINNIFKLQQGEFVSVEKIEGIVASGAHCPYVEQCWAYGDPTRRYIVAVVTLDENWKKETLAKFEKEGKGLKDLEEMVMRDVYKTCKAKSLQGFECIRNLRVHSEPFSAANGLATPTFKLIRNKLKEQFKDAIAVMYNELDAMEKEQIKKEGKMIIDSVKVD